MKRRWIDLPAATRRAWIDALAADGVDNEDTVRAALQADDEAAYRQWCRKNPRTGLGSWEPLR